MADLQNYGFRSSPNVKVMIINGRLSNLVITSSNKAPDAQIYVAYGQEMTQPVAPSTSSGDPNQGMGGGTATGGQQGGIPSGNPPLQQNLATNQDLVRLCNQATLADLTEAYSAARAYLGGNPGKEVTKDILLANGFTPNENVSLVIVNVSSSDLSMSANFNFPGTANYTINPSGISSSTG